MSTLQCKAAKECMMIYNNGMKIGTEGKFLKKAEMDKLHNECEAEALARMKATDFKSRMENKLKWIHTVKN
ncbi:hypothetical protein B566_EDAN016146 [Ephemera danica]|nr:hypothetical protein B566_EDAN016146 [Ephemera danica]